MTECKKCLLQNRFPSFITDIIMDFSGNDDESFYLNNLNSHILTQFPFSTTNCPCHCEHMMCDVCCRDLLEDVALERLYCRMEYNKQTQKLKQTQKQKLSSKEYVKRRVDVYRWKYPRKEIPERKSLTSNNRRYMV